MFKRRDRILQGRMEKGLPFFDSEKVSVDSSVPRALSVYPSTGKEVPIQLPANVVLKTVNGQPMAFRRESNQVVPQLPPLNGTTGIVRAASSVEVCVSLLWL